MSHGALPDALPPAARRDTAARTAGTRRPHGGHPRPLSQELFFYGAGFGDLYRAGLAALHGPELPLELCAARQQREEAGVAERAPPATLAEALRSRPTTYNTVGFMCLYCADDGIGIQNDQ